MSTTFVNGIDGDPLYATRAEQDQYGNNIDQTYAKKSEIPTVPVQDVEVNGSSVVNAQGVAEISIRNVPMSTSQDSGKILEVNSSGEPQWTDPQTYSQQQSDWNQTNSSAVDYIKNKPQNIVQDADYVHTDVNFTNADKSKLDGIEAGAEANDVEDVRVNGTSVVSNKIADVTVPTKTSDLTNDSGFITANDIPAQVQSDWTEADSSDPSYIQNKPNLATVATSGSYNDLSDKPTIPTVPVQDVEVNGSSVVNASGVAEVTVPTKTSDLNNDSGFITASQVPAQEQSDWNQTNSSAVDYIKNKPTINNVPAVTSSDDGKVLKASYSGGVGSYEWANESGGGGTVTDVLVDGTSVVNAQGQAIIAMPTDLVPAVTSSDDGKILTATYSGGQASYAWSDPQTYSQIQSNWTQSDSTAVDYIKNKPQGLTLQAGTNITLTENSGILTISAAGGGSGTVTDVTVDGVSVVNAQGVASITMPTVPTKTSDLTNDSGFITASQVPAQVNSDWNASSGVAQILNKPSIPTIGTITL